MTRTLAFPLLLILLAGCRWPGVDQHEHEYRPGRQDPGYYEKFDQPASANAASNEKGQR